MAETVMIVPYEIHFVMVDRIGGFGGEVFCLMDAYFTVDADNDIRFAVDKSQIMRYGQDSHAFAQNG